LSALFLSAVLRDRTEQTAPAPANPPAADTTVTTTTVTTPAAGDTVIKDWNRRILSFTTKTKDSSGKDTLSVDFPTLDIAKSFATSPTCSNLNLVDAGHAPGQSLDQLRDVTWRQIFEVVLKHVRLHLH